MAKFINTPGEQGQLIPAYLGEWIPENHLVYLVNDIVGQLNLSPIIANYSHRGEEAYHPALMLKILFYGYATGIFTSRKLHEALIENIPFRWLSGGLRPDYRTISDFRKDHLADLPKYFSQIVQIASDLGYASLGHVSIDGSKIKANASKHKAMSRDRMKKEIEKLEQEIKEVLEKAQQDDLIDDVPSILFPQQEEIDNRTLRLEKIRVMLKELDERKPESESDNPEKDQINFTDPESRIMDTKTQGVIQGYNPQIAVDADHGLIVGLKMSNCSNDKQQFEGVLESIKEATGRVPVKMTADAGYSSANNIKAAAAAGVDAYIADAREAKEAKNRFDKVNFVYLAEIDAYRCPAGRLLTLKRVANENNPNRPTERLYEGQECKSCEFQAECTKAKSGKRIVSRYEDDAKKEAMHNKVRSEEGKAIYRMRKAIVEPVWGQMKQCQGFRQFHLRSEKKVAGEFVLLAISHNLRKIHSAQFPKPSTIYKREKSAQKRRKTG